MKVCRGEICVRFSCQHAHVLNFRVLFILRAAQIEFSQHLSCIRFTVALPLLVSLPPFRALSSVRGNARGRGGASSL
jgi:hypothetical protein